MNKRFVANRNRIRETGRLTAAGLTIVELLVVIGIVGVLAALLVPTVSSSRQRARRIECVSILRGASQALNAGLQDNGGYFPAVYYTFNGTQFPVTVTLKGTGDTSDAYFRSLTGKGLKCPVDERPVQVLGRATSGMPALVPSSYAYNLSLPLLYRNVSRVSDPSNIVTFYDGVADGVVGTWQYTSTWAAGTVRARHSGYANYVYLDGHAESLADFPAVAFAGGAQWATANPPATPASPGPTSSTHPSTTTTSTTRPSTSTTSTSTTTSSTSSTTSSTTSTSTTSTTIPGLSGIIEITNNTPFSCVTPTITITKDDLRDGFSYTGRATAITVNPKANSSSITYHGSNYVLQQGAKYFISGSWMEVVIYQDRNKWYVVISSSSSNTTIVKQ